MVRTYPGFLRLPPSSPSSSSPPPLPPLTLSALPLLFFLPLSFFLPKRLLARSLFSTVILELDNLGAAADVAAAAAAM